MYYNLNKRRGWLLSKGLWGGRGTPKEGEKNLVLYDDAKTKLG